MAPPTKPYIDEMMTIWPAARRRMPGSTARVTATAPWKLVRNT